MPSKMPTADAGLIVLSLFDLGFLVLMKYSRALDMSTTSRSLANWSLPEEAWWSVRQGVVPIDSQYSSQTSNG